MSLTKVSFSMIDGEAVSVADYGADPSGLTDSSSAFNAAVDAVIAKGGGPLWVPYGTYLINLDWSSRVIAGGYSKILFYGNNSRFLGVSGASALLTIDRGGSGDNYLGSAIIFHDCRFATESNVCSGGTPVINHAVYFSRSSADFYNCVFSGGSRSAFYGYNYQYGKFVDCQFNCSSVSPTIYPSAGCWIQSRYSETIADQMVFDRCVFDSSRNGLYIEGCQTLRVLNTRFQQHFVNGEGGLVIKNFLDGVGSENILISACHFEINQVRDIYMPNGSTSRTRVERCLFANPIGYIPSFVATAEQVSTVMSYIDNDFRTASGPTLTMSGNNAVLNYMGNDKNPTSVSTPDTNPQPIIQNPGSNNIDFKFSQLKLSAFWGRPGLLLDSYYLWVDAAGRLRIKNGAPTSDTDGTVVGTQT